MAERRMFAKTIIDSDAFLEMPISSQCLYFHLSMRADDEGFINKPKTIMRMIGAKDDDMNVLIARKFIIPFESGVVVIKHWKIHNYIRGDRIHSTKYTDEKALLVQNENNAYTLLTDTCPSDVSQLTATCHTEVRLGKVRLGKVSKEEELLADCNVTCNADVTECNATDKIREDKNRLDNNIEGKRKRFTPPTVSDVRAYCAERGNNVDAQRFVDFYTSNGWLVGKNHMKDWKAAVRTWEQRNGKKDDGKPRSTYQCPTRL